MAAWNLTNRPTGGDVFVVVVKCAESLRNWNWGIRDQVVKRDMCPKAPNSFFSLQLLGMIKISLSQPPKVRLKCDADIAARRFHSVGTRKLVAAAGAD